MKTFVLFGYLDPGSGALLWQMLLSAALGTCILFRQFREKAKAAAGQIWRAVRRPRGSPRPPEEGS